MMNKRDRIWLQVAVFSCCLPSTLYAGAVRLASQDGFASARGEAFAATADNPSAIYYNPAGLTQIEGISIRGGIYGIHYDPTYTPPSGSSIFHIEKREAAVPQSFFSYTMEKVPLSFGLGVYAPYGLGVEWPQNTGFRAVGTKSQLNYLRANPVVAVKLPYHISIAGGAMVDYTSIDLESGLRRNQLPPPFTDYFKFNGHGWMVGWNVGLLWQPIEQISVGATLRSSTSVTMEGHTDIEFYPVIPTTYTSPARADFTFPYTTTFGVSWRPTPKWNLEFDADYTDWSSFGTITIYQSNPNINVQPNPSFILDWQASWMLEFGVTRYFEKGWHASAGYVFNQNSVPDAHYTPLVPDQDRHFFAIGAGHKGKHIDFDLLYQFGYGPSRTVSGSVPSNVGQIQNQSADGTYKFISHAVLLTAGLRF